MKPGAKAAWFLQTALDGNAAGNLPLPRGCRGEGRVVFRLLVPVVEPGIFFLQMPGVRKDDAAQINGGRRRINRAAKAFPDQARNPAAVIEVRVGQNHRINAGRRHRRRLPVAQPPLLRALEHAAIDEGLEAVVAVRVRTGVDQVLGAGHGTRRAEKLDVGQESSSHGREILDC